MNKVANYKEAIYKEAKEKKEKNPDRDALKYLGAAAGASGVNFASIEASKKIINKGKITDKEILELARQKAEDLGFSDKNTIIVKKTPDNTHSSAWSGGYNRPDIVVGDNEFIVRHELGHVADGVKRTKKKHNAKYLSDDMKYMKFMNDKVESEKTYKKLIDEYMDLHDYVGHDDYQDRLDNYIKKKQAFQDFDSRVTDHNNYFINEANKERMLQDKRRVLKDGALLSLHSKSVRDFIRKKNDGKIKAVDKTMDVMDNPIAASAILGVIKDSPTLRSEFAASLDATKGMVSKYGRKKGLAMSLPIFAAQMGSYGTLAVAKEGLRGGIVRGGETLATKAAKKIKDKKGSK